MKKMPYINDKEVFKVVKFIERIVEDGKDRDKAVQIACGHYKMDPERVKPYIAFIPEAKNLEIPKEVANFKDYDTEEESAWEDVL